MMEFVISIIAIVISLISLFFGIFQYFKSLPMLKFKFYNSNYSFPAGRNGKILFEKGILGIEILVINSGNKEVSIIDILPPVEQTSQIKVFKEDLNKPYYFLKELTKLSWKKKLLQLMIIAQMAQENG